MIRWLLEIFSLLQRPALRFSTIDLDGYAAVGASKIGGKPDLPSPDFWPIGEQCKASYNDATEGYQELACFMAQVNLAEIADTMAGKDLPKAGAYILLLPRLGKR